MAAVETQTQETLSGISGGDMTMLEQAMGLRESQLEGSRLDPRTFGLVKIAALIALDAPPAATWREVGRSAAREVRRRDSEP